MPESEFAMLGADFSLPAMSSPLDCRLDEIHRIIGKKPEFLGEKLLRSDGERADWKRAQIACYLSTSQTTRVFGGPAPTPVDIVELVNTLIRRERGLE